MSRIALLMIGAELLDGRTPETNSHFLIGELTAAGYEVVETDDLALCCGAAGIYNILEPEASAQLGNRKATQIRSTGVHLVASANPGCEMQLRSHLGPDHEIAHPIEWYLRALQEQG